MVKLQKQARGNHIVAIPKIYMEAQGWHEGEVLAICPCKDGALRLVPLFRDKE